MGLLFAILIGALSGMLAGLIAYPLSRLFKGNKTVLTILMVAGFFTFNTLGKIYLMPQLQTWSLNRELKSIPAYRLIAENDPETYSEIYSDLKLVAQGKATKDEVLKKNKAKIEGLVFKYIPTASDPSVLQYMKVTVKELRQIYAKDPDKCMSALFPDKFGFVDVTQYVDSATQDEDLNALKDVIESSVKHPQEEPSEEQIGQIVDALPPEFTKEYGQKMEALNHLDDPKLDKKQTCDLVLTFYEKIFQLPETEAGPLLRNLLTQSD